MEHVKLEVLKEAGKTITDMEKRGKIKDFMEALTGKSEKKSKLKAFKSLLGNCKEWLKERTEGVSSILKYLLIIPLI